MPGKIYSSSLKKIVSLKISFIISEVILFLTLNISGISGSAYSYDGLSYLFSAGLEEEMTFHRVLTLTFVCARDLKVDGLQLN